MQYFLPVKIELNNEEQQLYSVVPPPNSKAKDANWNEISDAMENLTRSLFARSVIPEIRLHVFDHPHYAEKGKKSIKAIWEGNGTTGYKIVRSPFYVEFIHYFIDGPDVLDEVQEELCEILNDDMGLRESGFEYIKKFSRGIDRNNKSYIATQLFRLGLEFGLPPFEARSMRDKFISTK